MFSIVIRNKNEAFYLKKVLDILHTLYNDDFDEIIIVDNLSTDNSLHIAKEYNCKIVTIKDFSYGRAINMGIEAAKNEYVLLLSAHTIPIGNQFFKETLKHLNQKERIAGIRYVNSFQNYERAIENDFKVVEPLKYGLMAACCIIVKSVWEKYKFNEELGFSEDKEWSQQVSNEGYVISDLNETFYYFIKRTKASLLNRFKNETLADYMLFDKKPPSRFKIIISFFKKVFYTNTKKYFYQMLTDFKKAIIMLRIRKKVKN